MEQPWVSVSAAGLALNLIGLAVTLVGLDDLSSELFPHRPLPHRSAMRWGSRQLRRRRQSDVHIAVSASGGIAASGRARMMVTKARPGDEARPAEWHSYLESRLANLGDRIDWLSEDMIAADRAIDGRLAAESRERIAGDDALRQQLLNAVGGREGSGLVKAWWGLVAVGVGTLLQGVAGIVG